MNELIHWLAVVMAFSSGACFMYAIDRGEVQLVRDELQTRWRNWNVSRG